MDSMMMLSPKKLIKSARKWQKRAATGRKKISHPRFVQNQQISTSSSSVGEKGMFVIYTIDKKRFVLPISYLDSYIFQELFRMSEEEFGLSSCGPIILPCSSHIMNYILSLFQQGMNVDLEKVVLSYIISSSCSTNTTFHQDHKIQQSLGSLLCGY